MWPFSKWNEAEKLAIENAKAEVIQYYQKQYGTALENITIPKKTFYVFDSYSDSNIRSEIWRDDTYFYHLYHLGDSIRYVEERGFEDADHINYDIDYLRGKIKKWLYKIPLENIDYFQRTDSSYSTTEVTGGGGGGTSIKGAIIGGLIAGEVGAIIGSRKEIEPVKTKTKYHRLSYTKLFYFENEDRNTIYYKPDVYQILKELIPDKEYDYVMEKRKHETVQKVAKEETRTVRQRLIELNDLKESGLITDEEYNQKRKAILNDV